MVSLCFPLRDRDTAHLDLVPALAKSSAGGCLRARSAPCSAAPLHARGPASASLLQMIYWSMHLCPPAWAMGRMDHPDVELAARFLRPSSAIASSSESGPTCSTDPFYQAERAPTLPTSARRPAVFDYLDGRGADDGHHRRQQ